MQKVLKIKSFCIQVQKVENKFFSCYLLDKAKKYD